MNLSQPTKPLLDWARVDTLLLDMDGTLLDLAYDNWFWREAVPAAYGQRQGLSPAAALEALQPHFERLAHTLPWYCTRHWSQLTGLDIAAMKRATHTRMRALDGSAEFLAAVRASGRQIWLTTNAHADSWQVKLETTGLGRWLHRVISAHDLGAPKEDPLFWQRLQAQHPFQRERCLFADDSLPVLRAAVQYGIGQVVAMTAPDTREPLPRAMPGFSLAVRRLWELLPVPMIVDGGLIKAGEHLHQNLPLSCLPGAD